MSPEPLPKRVRVEEKQEDILKGVMRQTGISVEQAQDLAKAYGYDRNKLMQGARLMAKPRPRSSRL